MVHVADVQAGLAWYQRAFPLATCVREEEFELLLVDGVQLEVVLWLCCNFGGQRLVT